jgi:hypothetical protein
MLQRVIALLLQAQTGSQWRPCRRSSAKVLYMMANLYFQSHFPQNDRHESPDMKGAAEGHGCRSPKEPGCPLCNIRERALCQA